MTGYIERKSIGGGSQVQIYDTTVPNQQARLAIQFVERWGAVAAEPDGEDSVGRQKLKLQSPPDTARRACDAAVSLYEEFKQRDWLVEVPAPKLGKGEEFDSEV